MDKILTKKITMFPHFLNQEIIPKTKTKKEQATGFWLKYDFLNFINDFFEATANFLLGSN
jgi:hypothetical protein